MPKPDESGMAALFALAAVFLLLSGTAALLILSGHNRLATKEALQMTRLLESARSAVRLEAARLEKDAAARRKLDTTAKKGVFGRVQDIDIFYQASTAKVLTPEEDKYVTYRLTGASWQIKDNEPDPKNEIAADAKCSYAVALYRYEDSKMLFVRWEN